jgi:hypothetical protein
MFNPKVGRPQEETTMRKALIAATAAITLAVSTLAVPSVADARWGGGWGGGWHGGGWHGGGWGWGAAARQHFAFELRSFEAAAVKMKDASVAVWRFAET